MRIMIITVAGVASRFSQSIGRPCLKCLYYKNDIRESLLYHILSQNRAIDKYVIVGGFQFEKLERSIQLYFQEFRGRIILVRNDMYEAYGSGYSLYLGLDAIKDLMYDELVFAEGDLWVDDESFQRVWETYGNVITCNNEAILASKSVAFYYDREYRIHYIFDTTHSLLEIKEPFQGIFNSGQIWKFSRRECVLKAVSELAQDEWKQTNLSFIQQYFGCLKQEEYEIIRLQNWVNCNTVNDFRKVERLR